MSLVADSRARVRTCIVVIHQEWGGEGKGGDSTTACSRWPSLQPLSGSAGAVGPGTHGRTRVRAAALQAAGRWPCPHGRAKAVQLARRSWNSRWPTFLTTHRLQQPQQTVTAGRPSTTQRHGCSSPSSRIPKGSLPIRLAIWCRFVSAFTRNGISFSATGVGSGWHQADARSRVCSGWVAIGMKLHPFAHRVLNNHGNTRAV